MHTSVAQTGSLICSAQSCSKAIQRSTLHVLYHFMIHVPYTQLFANHTTVVVILQFTLAVPPDRVKI